MQTTHVPDDITPGTLGDPRHIWRIPDDRPLPALGHCADDVQQLPATTLRETLWDTVGRDLAFDGIELLRADSGAWSVDHGDGPEDPDTQYPAVEDPSVPENDVGAILDGEELRPVRVRATTTTLVVLRGQDGPVRAEVADVRIDEGDTDTALLRSARWWALSDDGSPGAVAQCASDALTHAAEDDGHSADDPVPTLASVRRPAAGAFWEDEGVPHYLEDLTAGQTFTTPGRTITEADVVSFASWTNDNNQVHTDVEFASRTRYGQRIVHGMLGASLCLGLIARTGVFEGSAVALLGIDQWRFTAPVFIGDTLTCEVEILSTRLTSSGKTGIVERTVTLRNQHGDVVQQGRMDVMVLTRDAAIG